MDARPDQEEMEQAIDEFLSCLQQTEGNGFQGLDTLMSKLPMPEKRTGRSLSVAAAMEAGFLPEHDDESSTIYLVCSLHLNSVCTVMLNTTGYP